MIPDKIRELIERYERNEHSYRSENYNEARLRQEFLNPMFKELGWDMENEQGYAEAYKDVIHEDSIQINGGRKAPDYCFRISQTKKFFVEAKKPAVSVADSKEAAYQLRRYAWSAKLPLSILTNFAEFAVYDCRFRPDANDKAGMRRSNYFTYKQYAEQWDFIASIFSREAILKGAFDKYATEGKGKRGTQPVDEEFLSEIEEWRKILARNIWLRNPGIALEDLNFAVGKIIDRLIFLRVCEDRGIEEYEQIGNLRNGIGSYLKMVGLFQKADDWYNAGLFHFNAKNKRAEGPDLLTPSLKIDDNVLKDIIKTLYLPAGPYEFSVFPADILGQVYEQFLGKVIIKKGRTVDPEEKPEVKKAGGVYYTPTYIVEYIVKQTVGKLVEDKTPEEVSHLRVLDPACGSGSFLIGAYQYLLDWHLTYYEEQIKKHKVKPALLPVYERAKDKWKLTLSERKRILLNNIYGVDIDAQAVEVTKLSLLLKVLEGESRASVQGEVDHTHRALPDLGNNIKCGNSLVGTEISIILQSKDFDPLSEEEWHKTNPFDYHTEFAPIFNQGGFDAVIGNPPYVRQETLGHQFKQYAKMKFDVYHGIADLYTYFIEYSHEVLKAGGRFGMICSNKWTRADYGLMLRLYLSSKTTLNEIVDFGELKVFQKAATFPAILLTESTPTKKQQFIYAPIKRLNFHSLQEEVDTVGLQLDNRAISGYNWTLAAQAEVSIFENMKRIGIPLGDYAKQGIYRGILTGLNEAFVIDGDKRKELIRADRKSAKLIKPFVVGDDVRKYHINRKNTYLILIPKGWTLKNAPRGANPVDWFRKTYSSLWNHLSIFKVKATNRLDQGDFWWELRACDYYSEFEKPKIMYPDIAKASRFTFDSDGLFIGNTAYIIPLKDYYLLGILNSSLIYSYYKRHATVLGDPDKGGRLRWIRQDVTKLPIRTINFKDKADKSRHDKMVRLVTKMLDLNKKLPEAKAPGEHEKIERQIKATDREIDLLVYELYELTEEEIAIVEGKEEKPET